MKRSIRTSALWAAAAATALTRTAAIADSFLSPKDLLVLQSNGDGGSVQSADSVTLFEFNPSTFQSTAAPAPVNTINLPTISLSYNGTLGLGLTLPDSSDHDGQLTLSQDGHQLVFGTYLSAVGPVDYFGSPVGPNIASPSQVPRVITVMHPDGTIDDSTQLTSDSDYYGVSLRQITSLDGTQFWTIGNGDKPYGGQDTIDLGGLRYTTLGASSTTSMNIGNGIDARTTRIFQGQLYVAGGSNNNPTGVHTLSTLGNGIPQSGTPTWTPLPASGAYANGTIFGNQSPAFLTLDDGTNVLYQSDSTTGRLEKYTQINGIWVLEGSLVFGKDNIENVAATVTPSGAVVYISNGSAIYQISDIGGDGTLAVAGLTNTAGPTQPPVYFPLPTPILTAPGGTSFRGISFAPSASGAVGNQIWGSATGGSWNSPANWADGIPNASGATATFALNVPGLAASGIVTLDGNQTVGHVVFNNASASYTLAPGSSGVLTIDNSDPNASGVPSIFSTSGNHTISAPVILTAGVTLSSQYQSSLAIGGRISGAGGVIVDGPGATYLNASNTFTGGITINGNLIIGAPGALPTGGAVTNNGSLTVRATNTTGNLSGTGALTVTNNSTLKIAANTGTSTQSSVTINSGSKFDISNNSLQINYAASATDPVSTIAGYLKAGFNSGTWTGTGLTSTTAATNPSALAVGYSDGNTDVGTSAQPNQILIKYTLAGDANLDGLVNFNDLVAVVQNFNKANTDWAHGNFLFGASTNFNDLVAVVQNFNKILTPAGSSGNQIGNTPASVQPLDVQLPEPTSLALLTFASLPLFRRKRRISHPDPHRHKQITEN